MSAVPAALLQYLENERLVLDFIYLSAGTIYFYDYLLTLRLEIKLIWFSPWNYTKIIFLVFRYMPFPGIYLAYQSQIFLDVSIETCKATFPVQAWLTMLQMVLAEVILAFRTWAVWNRNKAVGILLVVSMLASFIPQCKLLKEFTQSLDHEPAPYPGFRGCFVTRINRILWGNYAAFTATEAIFLVLMAISAFNSYRLGNFGRFSLIVHRDGIMSYVYLLCISVANVATVIVLPPSLILLLTPFEYNLYSVLTARIILNIREMGNKSMQTDLLSVYQEPPEAAIPLQFAHDSISSDPTA